MGCEANSRAPTLGVVAFCPWRQHPQMSALYVSTLGSSPRAGAACDSEFTISAGGGGGLDSAGCWPLREQRMRCRYSKMMLCRGCCCSVGHSPLHVPTENEMDSALLALPLMSLAGASVKHS